VDDAESIRALRRGLELGVTFYDTALIYGLGHSEEILGRAFAGHRDEIVIATKFHLRIEHDTREIVGEDLTDAGIRYAVEGSLRRLNTDHIDLLQLHKGDHPADQVDDILTTLEALVDEGQIRWYGWSTDDPERARVFAAGAHCTAVQQHLNLLGGNFETLAVCEELNLASINRGPLMMGLLTGKFTADTSLPENDVRHGWNFREGSIAEQMKKLDDLRDVLTSGGRTLAQGALGWLWARSPVTIPIPGFKTVAQVEDNAGALQLGPLSAEQMAQVDSILAVPSPV
jgi:aryl-alcohol dehydrogenase-like predicted oxidoreductase